MNENERGVFALDGITGMLIATTLLLSILAGLTYGAIVTQQASADQFYELKDEQSIRMNSVDNVNNRVDVSTK